jgi:hypothetical protein
MIMTAMIEMTALLEKPRPEDNECYGGNDLLESEIFHPPPLAHLFFSVPRTERLPVLTRGEPGDHSNPRTRIGSFRHPD